MGFRYTDPQTTGDLDSVDYQDVRIEKVTWELLRDQIEVVYRLGNFDDATGEWTPGVLPPRIYLIDDSDPDNDYSTVFEETFKTGSDTNAERFIEMLVNLLSLRLGLAGAYQKPGKSGKKKL
jgi:hypothetical protein